MQPGTMVIDRPLRSGQRIYARGDLVVLDIVSDGAEVFRTQGELDAHIARLQEKMKAAAANLDFEKAATLRDDIKRLRNADLGLPWPARRL